MPERDTAGIKNTLLAYSYYKWHLITITEWVQRSRDGREIRFYFLFCSICLRALGQIGFTVSQQDSSPVCEQCEKWDCKTTAIGRGSKLFTTFFFSQKNSSVFKLTIPLIADVIVSDVISFKTNAQVELLPPSWQMFPLLMQFLHPEIMLFYYLAKETSKVQIEALCYKTKCFYYLMLVENRIRNTISSINV